MAMYLFLTKKTHAEKTVTVWKKNSEDILWLNSFDVSEVQYHTTPILILGQFIPIPEVLSLTVWKKMLIIGLNE